MSTSNDEAFASLDIESDGNNPMQHSMRSIGIVVVCTDTHQEIDSFYRNIKPRSDATVEQKCMDNFWSKHPEQWSEVNRDAVEPEAAMNELDEWLSGLSEKFCIKWVACPANFDWMFLKCYYEMYNTRKVYELGFHCHCLDSMRRTYMKMKKIAGTPRFNNLLSNNAPYTHNALDDARCQGIMYLKLRDLVNKE